MSDTSSEPAPAAASPAAAASVRAPWLCAGAFLALALCVLCGSFFNSGSWNQNARLDAIFAFVEPGPDQWSFRIDGFLPQPDRGVNTGDWNRVGEHYYSNKLPGSILWGSLAYLPFYWALRLLGLDPSSTLLTSVSAHWINFWVGVVPLAVAAWAFYRLLARLGASHGRAFLAACGAFLGTALFPYGTQLWGHVTSAACVCGALYLQWGHADAEAPANADAATHAERRALWTGGLAGAAVCVDFLAAPFAAVCVLWAWRRSRRQAVHVVLGGAVGLLVLLGYNWYCFGSPLSFSIEGTKAAFLDQRRWLGVFGVASPEALWQLTFGSFRGLFPQMPVLLLSLVGFGYWLRRERRDPLLWGALATVLGTLWLTASFNGWHGGATVCARYLIPCLPLLALGLKELPAPLWARPVYVAVGGLSFLNMLAIAAVNPIVADRADQPLYRVIYGQFLRGALGGQKLPLRLQELGPEAGMSTTTNLGQLLGLQGLAQLVPVLGIVVVLLALGARRLGWQQSWRPAWARAQLGERWAAALSLLLIGVSFTYLLTLASALLGGDNAEFVLLSQRWGVAHPSGYPAYVLYLRLLSWLPGSTPAATAALATAVLGVLTLLVAFRVCVAWGASAFAALSCVLLLALSPRFWIAATHAEVFALNALLAALLLWLSAPSTPLQPERRLCCLAGLAGLGLANHLTIALLAPIGLVAAGAALRASPQRARAAGLALACLLLGLLPYAALPSLARAAGSGWSWGDWSAPAALWSHVLREDYGTFSLGLNEQGGQPLSHVGALLVQACADFLWLPLVLLPLGAWALARSPWRWHAGALLASLLTTGPLLVARMNLSTEGLSRSVIQRFYLLPEVVLIPILALGLGLLERALRTRLRPELALAAGLASVTAIGGAQLLGSSSELSEHHSPAVERYLRNTLRSAPPNAVILGTGDQRLFGFEALQAFGVRPDVQYINPRMLHYDWYRRRASERLGVPLPEPVNGNLSTVEVAQRVLQQGKQLFISDVFSDVLLKATRSYPWGTLIRILPPVEESPAPSDIEKANLQLFATYDLSYALPLDPSSWAFAAQAMYARPWSSLASLYRARGDEQHAAINAQRARDLSPGL